MRNRILPMFTPAEQEAFSQASERSRRINTLEFQAGLAETQRMPLHSAFLAANADSAPAHLSEQPDQQKRFGAGAIKIIKPLLLIAVSTAVTLLLMSGQESRLSTQLSKNAIHGAPQEIFVSAADPKLAAQPASVSEQISEQPQVSANLDYTAKTKELQLVVPERQFSYISQPRSASDSSFISVPLDQSNTSSKRSELAALGLRPIPNSNQRYVSNSGLEWQGGWELNNPKSNVERGNSYLGYLREKFADNNHKQLLVQSKEGDTLASSAAEHKIDIPILKYSK